MSPAPAGFAKNLKNLQGLKALAGLTQGIDLNFAAGSYSGASLASLSTTRSTQGYAETQAGAWTSFAANVPRITDKGLLVEEGRTNSIRNNSMQGAVAGTPGTLPTNGWTVDNNAALTRTIGLGTEDGIDYIDFRFQGTAAGTYIQLYFEDFTGAPAAANTQTWTQSAFAKRGATWTGINNVEIELKGYSGANASTENIGPTTKTIGTANLGLSRIDRTGTLANASTAKLRPTLIFRVTNGAAVDFTIRIGWPQLEQGALATSPIRTTGVPAGRAADVIYLPFTAGYLSTQTTVLAEVICPQAGFAFQHFASISTSVSSPADQLVLRGNSLGSQTIAIAHVANVQNAAFPGIATIPAANIILKAGYSLAQTDAKVAVNGAQTGTFDTDHTTPPNIAIFNRLYFGSGVNVGTAQFLNGYLRRCRLLPTAMTNAQLQAATA